MNYSKEQTSLMVETYSANPTRETVAILARQLGKSEKSIIGKLSKEGVYIRSVYVTKSGEKPVTKQELVREISEKLEIEYEKISGLEKSPKASLKALGEAIWKD